MLIPIAPLCLAFFSSDEAGLEWLATLIVSVGLLLPIWIAVIVREILNRIRLRDQTQYQEQLMQSVPVTGTVTAQIPASPPAVRVQVSMQDDAPFEMDLQVDSQPEIGAEIPLRYFPAKNQIMTGSDYSAAVLQARKDCGRIQGAIKKNRYFMLIPAAFTVYAAIRLMML